MGKIDWKGTLATVAPAIATALGGPLAGIAVNVAAGALGVEATEESVSAAILSGDPDSLVKLKEAEFSFKQSMKEAEIDLKKINADDRKSARALAVNTTLIPQVILSAIFIIAFALILHAVFAGDAVLSETMMNVGVFLLGILSAGITQIMNFFFGSSSGSKEKTAILGLKG